MATRRPLYQSGGDMTEIPDGDALPSGIIPDLLPSLSAATAGTVNLALAAGRENVCEVTTAGNITFNITSSGRARLTLLVTLGGAHQPTLQINGASTNVRWKDRTVPAWSLFVGNMYVFECYTNGTYLDVVNWYLYGIWTPAQISTMLWLDAADAATITTVSGNVSQWNDKSGNNRHAVQATAGYRPVYDSANNRITFDGTDDRLTGALPGLTAASWAFAYMPSTDTAYSVLGITTTGAAQGWDRFPGDGYSYPNRFRTSRVETYQAAPSSGTHILSGSSSSTGWQEWLNGSSPGAAAAAFGTNSTYTLGNDNSLASQTWYAGSISEVILLPSAWTTADRQKAEGYLAWKWGTVAGLPSNHPYKNAAP